jgi:acetoin:2,6-dichlorophenolindophenol oxidoreductase subunit beta
VVKATIRTATLRAISECMEKDRSIFILGEGSRVKYSLDYPQMLRRFPERVLTAPVAEGGLAGVALGASLDGMRPVVDLTFNDLALRAMDEIVNHVAKVHFMSGGKLRARVVIKADFNRPENAQSGNRLESFFLHFPGLRVVVPSTPSDAYYFMKAALEGEDPVLFFEDRIISAQEELDRTTSHLPLGKARTVTRGDDLTLVTYGCTLGFAIAAVKGLGAKSVEIIDLRSLNPLDVETVTSSVRRTGRLLLVEPDHAKLGVGAEIAALVGEKCFDKLRAPIRRIGTKDLLFPAAVTLQGHLLPTVSTIRRAAFELLSRSNGRRVRR